MSNPTPKQAGWRVEMSTGHALEGGDLALCGSLAEWDEVLPLTPTLTLTPTPTLTLTLTLTQVLPGTTIPWPPRAGGGGLPVPRFKSLQ